MNPQQSGPASTASFERQDDPRGPGSAGGVLGARPLMARTFHGSDPDTVAASAICEVTPTRCQARTRLYRDGRLVDQGFAVERISDHLEDPRAMVWLDLRDPDHDDLAVLQEEFGLHPVAIEDALVDRERPKIDRYRTHLFLTAYSARLDRATGELATSELAAFILPHALITIRKDDGLDIGKVVERWDASPDLARRESATCCTACSTTSWTATSRRCSPSTTRSRDWRTTCSRPPRRWTSRCSGARSSCASHW